LKYDPESLDQELFEVWRYLVRRLAFMPVLLALANFLGFAYAYLLGPLQTARNPYAVSGGELPPLLPQYLEYLRGVLRLDFGNLAQGEPIINVVLRTGLASLVLLILALACSILVGLPLGLNAVRSSPAKVSPWLTAIVTVGLASPGYFIGVILIALSIMYFIWGPGAEPLFPFQGFGWDDHLVLPTLALMALPTVKIAQITSGMLVEEMGKQYIVAARSLGHSSRSIRRRYAFRNILAPVVITIASSLRLMVAELIIIERLFGWPGIGRLFSTTVILTSQHNNFLSPPLVAALLTVLAATFLVSDTVAGVIVRGLDPRQVES